MKMVYWMSIGSITEGKRIGMDRLLRIMCAVLALGLLLGLAGLAEGVEVSAAEALGIERILSGENGLQTVSSKSASAYFIKVNLRRQRVTIYRKAEGKWKKLDTKKCSSGVSATPTPRGIYRVKKKKFTFVQDGQNWYYVTYFHHGFAFHSTGEKGGKFNNSVLGKPTSHGCLRMKPKDAKWIYEHIPSGTYIQIE